MVSHMVYISEERTEINEQVKVSLQIAVSALKGSQVH